MIRACTALFASMAIAGGSSALAGSNAITFGNYEAKGDLIVVDVMYASNDWLAGFQFDIIGANIIDASGGLCAENNWLLEHSELRVVGVGLGGLFIEPSNVPEVLLQLTLEPTDTLVRFEKAIFANPDAQEIPIDATSVLDLGDEPCLGDLNNDGEVNGADLGLMLVAFSGSDPNADLNDDGVVNGADLGLMLVGWGDCP